MYSLVFAIVLIDKVHCLGKRALFAYYYEAVFPHFLLKTHQIGHAVEAFDYVIFSEVVDEQNSMCLPRDGCHHLTNCLLHFWPLYGQGHQLLSTQLSDHGILECCGRSCYRLLWHINAKVHSISPKQLQKVSRIINTLLLCVQYEQMRHPFGKPLSHGQ